MKKIFRNIALCMVPALFVCPMSLKAQSLVPADSVDYALSSMFAGYLLPEMPNTESARTSFIEGLRETMVCGHSMDYYYGLLNGLNVLNRLLNIEKMGLEVDEAKVMRVLADLVEEGHTGTLNKEQANDIINRQFAALHEQANKFSVEKEQAFIDSIAALPGAKPYPSGIVFQTLKEGEGDVTPVDGQNVMVNYQGRLSNGTVFDETEHEVSFIVGQLVPGFNEGLKMMKPGGTYRLVIPASLAYGEEGIDGAIPGNAALDFTVTLESIPNIQTSNQNN